jgi:hypothetical protein
MTTDGNFMLQLIYQHLKMFGAKKTNDFVDGL